MWNAPWVAIDARLEDGRLVGGIHLATVDVHTPGSPHPLTFQECYGFDFPLRWVTRLDCVSADRQPAVIERKRRPLESTRMRLLAAVTRSWRQAAGAVAEPGGGDTKPEKDKAIKELEEYRERLAEDPLTYARCWCRSSRTRARRRSRTRSWWRRGSPWPAWCAT